MSKKEFLFKLILIGSSNVGKTSIIKQLISQEFNDNFISTIGVHFYTKKLFINDKKIEFLIWDTAGLEKFKSVTKNYYKTSNVCIIVFDVTDKQSFEDVFEWLNFYKENCNENNNKIFLFGNKIDKNLERSVNAEDIDDFCKRNNLIYYETSAKDGKNINDVFRNVGKKLIEEINDDRKNIEKENNNNINLNNEKNEENEKFFCC